MKLFTFLVLSFIRIYNFCPAKAQLYISNTAEIKLSGNIQLTLNDINLINDGTFNQTEGTVRFSGTTNTSISGNNPIRFYNLDIAKTTGNQISLLRTISGDNLINFLSGYINLAGFNLLLSASALLIGESETSRLTSTAGGYAEITNMLNAPALANPGNLGASISSSANLGSTTIRRGHQSQTNGAGAGNSINRYFDIMPTNNTALNATLNFKYFDAELNGLTESSLSLWKSVNNANWTNQGFDRRSVTTNYVEKSNIADFSRWTLSNPGNALPVLFVLFNVKCNNNKVDINWKTASEQNSSRFEVQRSENGNNWTTIGTMPAAGNSSSERSYSFIDNNPHSSTAFYRIAEFDIDGKKQYTAVIKNDCGPVPLFKVWPNPVETTLYISLTVTEASQVLISLVDSKGALLQKKTRSVLTGNNQLELNTATLLPGTYHLLMEWNNGALKKIVKFIKQ